MRAATLTLCSATRSDLGRRENNEDAVFATERLVAVADGVGGAAAGEVASQWVINQMSGLDKRRLSGSLEEELGQAVMSANDTLSFLIDCRPELAGMASTLTALALSNTGEYLLANVGDSRTYLLRDGRLQQLSKDQSLVQVLIDQGAISGDQAREHPQRSIVLEALDGGQRSQPSIARHPARAGDRLLLCSDGLSDAVGDEEIAGLLATPDRNEASRGLISAALEHGGRDNISVIVADVVRSDRPGLGWLRALPPPDGADDLPSHP
jgi:serine/threonine protein phosphatase PrpC